MLKESVELHLDGIDAAIFDLDGTMIDSMHWHGKAWHAALTRCYRLSMTEEEFRTKYLGLRTDVLLPLLLQRKVPPLELSKFASFKEKVYREIYDPHIQEVPGLTEILHGLRGKGIKTAIATGAPLTSRNWVLGRLNVSDLFDVIRGEEHAIKAKPDPEINLVTAAAIGVEPGRCILFEDTPQGVEAGIRAGMRVIGVMTSHTAEELSGIYLAIRDYRQLQLR